MIHVIDGIALKLIYVAKLLSIIIYQTLSQFHTKFVPERDPCLSDRE